MAESQNQVHNLGVTAWVEKSKKKRYEIGLVEKSGNETRVFLDVFPGGPSRVCTLKFLSGSFQSDSQSRTALGHSSSVGSSLSNGQIPKKTLLS